ncbi:MAG: hypothetical protein E7270_05825 [Lachnospiraceae bacterium]|nr:hypothetical protein [Lachnospiraceae bacterium]
MKKESKSQVKDVESARAKKYILILFIYTFIMIAIVVLGFLFPKKNDNALPQREDLTENFSSTLIM